MRILELGCFEGASTTWILENLASHATTTVTVVDSFEGGMEHQAHELDFLEFRFRENVNKCANASKLQVIKDRTEHALIKLRSEQAKFDFIYIDASHVAIDVLHDAVLCWSMLNQGGTLVFDDWTWKGYMEDVYNPRMAITAFLECAAPEIKVQETESQIWITRVENHIPATKNHDPTLWYGNGSPLKFLLDSSDGAKQGSIAPSA
ncbi:membrane protein [Phlyctema vagabunda]|uniref:Membrane protein n=1 Tax=Phlyctema vagabunda TaxID=108571 RepID=A0ABR4P4A9_9HELO